MLGVAVSRNDHLIVPTFRPEGLMYSVSESKETLQVHEGQQHTAQTAEYVSDELHLWEILDIPIVAGSNLQDKGPFFKAPDCLLTSSAI